MATSLCMSWQEFYVENGEMPAYLFNTRPLVLEHLLPKAC